MFKLFLIFAGLAVASGSRLYFYRRDYNYIEEFDAFYKFHLDPEIKSWTDAFKACDDEGAKLFYPKDDSEWAVVKNLTDSLSTPFNATEIVLGISDQYGFGEFVTVDGQPLPTSIPIDDNDASGPRCVYMEINTGSYNVDSCVTSESSPFVCKKVDETPCPTIDLDYVYYKEVKKCYKVNNRLKTWQEAYHACYLEGAMLAVVENESEANQIQQIVEDSNVYGYHAGFSRIDDSYFTVTGKRFDKLYQRWSDNADRTRNQCGTVVRYSNNLYTNTIPCDYVLPFVCEMNARIFV